MSEIPKAYEPQSVADKWYGFWLKQGCFTADPGRVSDQAPSVFHRHSAAQSFLEPY
jgi:hypothetical protein